MNQLLRCKIYDKEFWTEIEFNKKVEGSIIFEYDKETGFGDEAREWVYNPNTDTFWFQKKRIEFFNGLANIKAIEIIRKKLYTFHHDCFGSTECPNEYFEDRSFLGREGVVLREYYESPAFYEIEVYKITTPTEVLYLIKDKQKVDEETAYGHLGAKYEELRGFHRGRVETN